MLIAPDSTLVDTGGEFIFAVLTKLTTGGFKHLLTVNRAYFRIRHQFLVGFGPDSRGEYREH
jgi:hypoxanthine-guanine phosphoribosyltransferase